MNNPKSLLVWQKSIYFVKEIYLITAEFPKEESFALSQQLRRAAISISSNIAEGSGRGTNSEFAHFLDIAQGSAYEIETQLIIANLLNYIDKNEFDKLNAFIIEIQKMLNGLIHKVRHE
ncbi:MAG: four helix bundle protein [Prevotellaceae bacterium]|jgi:four helix bundle protein|nr:four helix bundle protein [Prevotellaceae bacterium]